ncbi:sugar transferase [Rubritalea sp.]|uniref:sugar transferase n=1 Tax=Rubritalea sp. TaxID=2109375 RepID=UPI003EF87441
MTCGLGCLGHSSLLTPHSSLLTPHSSLLTLLFGSRKKEEFSLQALQLLDAFLVWAGFAIASAVRWNVIDQQYSGLGLNPIAWLLFIVVPFTPLTLELFGFYKNTLNLKASAALWKVIQTAAVLGAVVGGCVLAFKLDPSSRLVLVFGGFFALNFVFWRFVWVRNVLRRRVKKGADRERAILVGALEDLAEFEAELPSSVTDYLEICAHFDLNGREVSELADVIVEASAQRVIVSPRHVLFDKVGEAVSISEVQGLEVWVAANFVSAQISRPAFDTLGDKPMLVLRSTPELSWALLAKSLLDRCFALAVIVASSPLWLLAAVGIMLSNPGPVFFRQRRAGKYGKEFKMWKFRTMCLDAEEKLAKVKEQMGNQMTGPVFKLEDDPRVFPFARFLRKWSIDELPQFINVLMGDMSVVGPRPLPVYEVKEFEQSAHRRRLSVKPGITCTWQAGGRNTITSFDDWVKMDLEYIDNWSLWLDLKIICKTIPAVLFSKGAS